MKIPPGFTEEEVLVLIDKVSRHLISRFRFGCHELDDMRQQARIEAMDGLERYDGVRPLENFLWTHIHNRLFNFKRDNYERPGKPCNICPSYLKKDDLCGIYDDRLECEMYRNCVYRNLTKKNIISPIELCNVSDEYEENMKAYDNVVDTITFNEIKTLLDKGLPVEMRSDYIKMLYNLRVSKQRRAEIYEKIIEIVDEGGYGESYS